MEQRKGSALWETVRTVGYAILIALVVRTFAFEPFNIPSGSMKPTLLVGDYLFVSKYSYGYSRYSLPWSPPLFDGRILGSEPERGDVVVFKKPTDNKTDYIKRLIGLPGETMEIDHGQLCPADDVIDTIKAQGARIEVTPEAIRIEGGNVEIRRTRSRK